MNKRRLIFFGIFGAYHVLAFVFTLVLENNTGLLFKMVGYLSTLKYATFSGVLLFAVDFVWSWRESKAAAKMQEAARHENNTLKAKVYDLQETSKTAVPTTNLNLKD